jgi:hypothetical protein
MRYLLFTAFFIAGFASCSTVESPTTREDELREGKWKRIAGTEKWNPAIGLDTLKYTFDSLHKCKKDDYLVFRTNFDGSQFNADKCDFSEPDEVSFRWELAENGGKIHFWSANQTFFNQNAVNANFVTYNPSQFTIRYTEYLRNPTDTTMRDTVVYTHTFAKF